MSRPILAVGAWFKNSVCAMHGDEIRLSPLIGDLDSAENCRAHAATLLSMLDWLGAPPALIAHDLHPDFFSSRQAALHAARLGAATVPVQHHHAHIAAVCYEHRHRGAVLGLALDGVGLGADGTAWGGELLRVDGANYRRLGHLKPLPLPGGDRAAREPWRMAAAVYHALGRNADIAARFDQAAAATVAAMLQRDLNCPRTSSMGRIFDAAAGLLGLCNVMNYEAEAAIALEQAATCHIDAHGWPDAIASGFVLEPTGQLDLAPCLAALDRAADGVANVDCAAAIFHATLIDALSAWIAWAAADQGLTTVACGGGCFLNRLLASGLRRALERRGLNVLFPIHLSPGDAAIAVGQAWIAQHTLES
ncbi:MAG TPA: carbamoyltransferase HypF [Rhodocyclaceae bacterium]|nr:carbamoyltransferase HypF [Rhodocyclaceae bacterium]